MGAAQWGFRVLAAKRGKLSQGNFQSADRCQNFELCLSLVYPRKLVCRAFALQLLVFHVGVRITRPRPRACAPAGMRDETTGKATDSSKGMVVIIITGCVCGRRGPCVLIRFVEEVDRQRRHLRALAANAAGELNVLGHDGHALLC